MYGALLFLGEPVRLLAELGGHSSEIRFIISANCFS